MKLCDIFLAYYNRVGLIWTLFNLPYVFRLFFIFFYFFIPHNILIIGENLMRFPGLKIISMLC